MATMRELQSEYELLMTTRRRLIDERSQLQRDSTDGAAFQDHNHRMRAYMIAFDSYVIALATRRQELQLKRNGHGG